MRRIFAVLIGGFPAVRGAWAGAAIAAADGLALGFGFVAGLLPRTLGIGGVFSSVTIAEFHMTVYTAQAVFGALLGVLVHRFGARIPPRWIPVLGVLRARSDRRPPNVTRCRDETQKSVATVENTRCTSSASMTLMRGQPDVSALRSRLRRCGAGQYRHSADSRCMGHTPSGVSLTWTFSD